MYFKPFGCRIFGPGCIVHNIPKIQRKREALNSRAAHNRSHECALFGLAPARPPTIRC